VDTPIDNSAAVKGAAPSRSIAFITWVCFGVEKGEDDKETRAKSQYWGTTSQVLGRRRKKAACCEWSVG
jgi:hypothetical protein